MPEFIIAKLALLPFPDNNNALTHKNLWIWLWSYYTVTLLSIFNNYRLTFIGLFISGVLPVFAVYTPMNMVWITFSASGWGTHISHSGRFLLLHLSCSGNVPHSDLWFCGSPICYPSWELDFHWVRTSFHRLYHYKVVGNNQVYQFCSSGKHHLH